MRGAERAVMRPPPIAARAALRARCAMRDAADRAPAL
ncbi:hypothetical protein BMAJHU_I0549, partial [Burkholderia mallei JHU]